MGSLPVILASRAEWFGQSSSYIGLPAGLQRHLQWFCPVKRPIPPLDGQNVGGEARFLLNNMAPSLTACDSESLHRCVSTYLCSSQ